MTHQDTTPESVANKAVADSTTSNTGSPAPAVAPAVPKASADPSRWGRVDADGTVWIGGQVQPVIDGQISW